LGNGLNLNIRFYQPEDDKHIVELLKKTFPKWNNFKDPLNLWRWKYVDTPQKTVVTVIVVDNKIVGCNHNIIYNAKIGSEVESIQYADDLAVDINYRGQGFWGKIRDFKRTRVTPIKYKFSTTVNPIVRESREGRNRGILPFPVTRMVKIKDIGLHLRMRPMKNTLSVKYGYIILNLINRITNQFSSHIKRIDEFNLVPITEFDEGIDNFWEKIKDDYNFILERKQAYLNWRFRDNERGKHVKIQAVKGEEILGYMVIGLKEEEGYTEGQIEDLIALKNRLDVVDALLGYACKYFDGLGVNTVYYQVVEGHPYQIVSKLKGFIDSHSKPYIGFDYGEEWSEKTGHPIEDKPEFLKQTTPSQVYFNYTETI
jgi:hypothetical protein